MTGKYKLILKDSSKNILKQLNEGAIYTVNVDLIDSEGNQDRLNNLEVLANDFEDVKEIIREYLELDDSVKIEFAGPNPRHIEEPEEFLLRALPELDIAYKRY